MTLPGTPDAPWIIARAGLPGLGGHIGPEPEDFRVCELPAYAPSGDGPHFYVEVEKRGLSTGYVRDALARAAGVKPMDIGCAGRKDTLAITRQWFSVPVEPVLPEAPSSPPGAEIRFLCEPIRHKNKLRMGHLHGNAFDVRLLGVSPDAEARWPRLLEVLAPGVPNYFGEQRFGVGARNLDEARAFLQNPRRRVRDPEFLASVFQSAVFNRWLGQRVLAGTLNRALAGDVLRKRETGGLFVCADAETDSARVEAGEVDVTGPLPGAKTFPAEGESAELEAAALASMELSDGELETLKRFAPGTRRPSRVPVAGLTFALTDASARLTFTLPAGSFATVLLGELCQTDGPLRPARALEDAGA